MEKRKYCIYYHMSPDKRYYIGQTCQDLENRWKNGAGYKSKKFNIDIINSLGGWQSFEHGILEDNIDLENIDEREAYYINLFNSVDNGFNTYRENYNGYHFSDLWANEEIKEKIILKLKEQRNTKEYKENQSRLMSEKWKDDEYRKKQNDSWTEERRNKLSEKTKECWNDDEYRNKISTFQSEYKKELWKDADYRKKMCTSVRCIETGEVFESVKAAAEWAGVKSNTLSSALKSKTHQSGKHPETGEKLHWEIVSEKGVV